MLVVMRWPVGGIRTFCRYVYNQFDKDRYRFTVLAPEADETTHLADDLKNYDINWITTTYGGSRAYLPPSTVAKTIALGNFDIIHSHGLSAGLLSALPAKLAGIPHLMTLHDSFNESQLSGLQGMVKKILISIGLLFVDTIHHVSHDAKENMLKYLPIARRLEAKIIVARNGIIVTEFLNSRRRDYFQELGLEPGVFLVGFLGRFMAPKGFGCLIDAVGILDREKNVDPSIRILCFGWGGFIREDQHKIREKGLEKYFIFLPFTADVAASLKGLDVLAIPSLWEACPLLPMEAMVAGLPIIGTNCRGLREVMLDNNVSVRKIRAGDSRALAEAIMSEIETPRREQAEMYVARAEKLFDVRHQAVVIQARVLELTGRCQHRKNNTENGCGSRLIDESLCASEVERFAGEMKNHRMV